MIKKLYEKVYCEKNKFRNILFLTNDLSLNNEPETISRVKQFTKIYNRQTHKMCVFLCILRATSAIDIIVVGQISSRKHINQMLGQEMPTSYYLYR